MDTRYDLLLCDADDTLFDFGKAEENAFEEVCAYLGFEATPELHATYSRINAALWKLLEQGGITQKVLRVRRFEQFLEAIGRSDLDAVQASGVFADALGRQSVPIKGAVEAIARWSKIVPVIIVTNGISKIQHGRMNGSEVRHYIRGMVISEEVGAAKPDPLMLEKGMDPANMDDVRAHGEMVYANYCRRIEESVRKYDDKATIFHNAGHITHGRRDIAGYDTHLELESLPTGGWGYDHFPMSAAYTRTLGVEFLGMTGKFHTTWGEFGGFKHPNALIYEAALSIACGACCSIGDQLHPNGEMNESTYRLIGAAYAEVEKKEPWCVGAKNHADIAVLSCEAFLQSGRNGKGTDSNVGACRILLEGKFLFDFIDRETAFDGYKLIILPDLIRADDELTARLSDYIAKGGKVLLSGESGVKTDSDEFALNVGAKFAGKAAHQPNYMIPGFDCVNGKTSYVMYKPGYCLTDVTGEVFAESGESYFNRGPFFFSSHQHTPNDPAKAAPAAVISGNVAYIGWNVFEDYATIGELHMKELVLCALNRLLPEAERKVTAGLPDRGIVTAAKQGEREIVHLLFAYTTVRGKKTEIIEDAVPLYNVPVTLQVDAEPKKVSLVPSCEEIPFEYADGRVRFTVPEVTLHQMVCVE